MELRRQSRLRSYATPDLEPWKGSRPPAVNVGGFPTGSAGVVSGFHLASNTNLISVGLSAVTVISAIFDP